MFAEYSTREIFVTPELSKFINDGFITREEVRANRQYRTTRNALIVAIAALLFNVGFNTCNKLVMDKKENIERDNSRCRDSGHYQKQKYNLSGRNKDTTRNDRPKK